MTHPGAFYFIMGENDAAAPVRRRVAAKSELDDTLAGATAASVVSLCTAKISRLDVLQKILKSTVGKSTDSLRLIVGYERPMMPPTKSFGKTISITDEGEDLNMVMTKKQSGLTILFMVSSDVRFSWWFIPAEVSGLKPNEMFDCWIAPQDLISMLKAYNHVDEGLFQFYQDKIKLRLANSSVVSFHYTESGSDKDARPVVVESNPNVSTKMSGGSLLQKIRAMETDETPDCTMELHDKKVSGGKHSVSLVFRTESYRWSLDDGYSATVEGTDLRTVDFRHAVQPTHIKKEPDIGETTSQNMGDVLGNAEAAADAAPPPPPPDLEEYFKLSERYTQAVESGEVKDGYPMRIPEGEYTRCMRNKFAGKELLSTFRDIASEIQSASFLFCVGTDAQKPLITLVTPIMLGANKIALGLHLLVCKVSDD